MQSEAGREETSDQASVLIEDMLIQLNRSRTSPLETRRRIFRDLQRQLHPDKNINNAEVAKPAFQKLMESRELFLKE